MVLKYDFSKEFTKSGNKRQKADEFSDIIL